MEFLGKIFKAFFEVLLFLEPSAMDEAFAFSKIFAFISGLFNKGE